MLRAATEASAGRLNLLAVTVLTSLSDDDLHEIGVPDRVVDQALRMAALARSAGCQGIVTSPRELLPLRKLLGESFTIVTPGIRRRVRRPMISSGPQHRPRPSAMAPATSSLDGRLPTPRIPSRLPRPLFLKWSKQKSAGDYVLAIALQLPSEVLSCVVYFHSCIGFTECVAQTPATTYRPARVNPRPSRWSSRQARKCC